MACMMPVPPTPIRPGHDLRSLRILPSYDAIPTFQCSVAPLDDITVFRKISTFVSIITLAFLGRFVCFLYQWKQEWITKFSTSPLTKHKLNLPLTQQEHVLRRLWSTASCSVIDRTSCLQLSQKVLLFIYFGGNVRNFIAVFWQKKSVTIS